MDIAHTIFVLIFSLRARIRIISNTEIYKCGFVSVTIQNKCASNMEQARFE